MNGKKSGRIPRPLSITSSTYSRGPSVNVTVISPSWGEFHRSGQDIPDDLPEATGITHEAPALARIRPGTAMSSAARAPQALAAGQLGYDPPVGRWA
jgi:hypothetical protein